MQEPGSLYDKIKMINTPEDIAKWRAERKRKYPNKDNTYTEQESKEIISGKDKCLSETLQKKFKRKKQLEETESKEEIDEKCDFSAASTIDHEDNKSKDNDIKDSCVKLTELNCLSGFTNACGSDDETEYVNPEETKLNNLNKVETIDIKRKRDYVNGPNINKKRIEEDVKTDKFRHENFRKRKITLFEKMLEYDVAQERHILLQCVRFVVNSNFFIDSSKLNQ